MPKLSCRFLAEVWLYPGAAGWHFATLPKRQAQEIKRLLGDAARG